jgi:hypothetical protein
MRFRCLQAFPNHVPVRLGRGDSMRRFLLKTVQNVNRITELDRVDSTERAAARVLNYLKDGSRPVAF